MGLLDGRNVGHASHAVAIPYGISGDGGDLATAADSASLHMGSADYTIEFWYNGAGQAAAWEPCTKTDAWQIGINKSITAISLWCNIEDEYVEWSSSGTGNLWDGNWHHLAYVRDKTNSTVLLFADGVLLTNDRANPVNNGATPDGAIMNILSNPYAEYFNGTIDEFRISNIKRYTGNFAVATARFTTDANTMALYHFQENIGVTAADDSGNGNDLTFSARVAAPAWATGKFA